MKLPSFSITKLKTIKKRYIILGIIGLFIIFSIIRGALKEDTSKEFFTVETGTVTETIILAGDVDMKDRVDLGFGSGGRVSSVLVEEGDVVQEGDVLARLSMNQLSAELLEAEANLRQAQADSLASGVDLDYSYQNLENIIAQQDVLVESARNALFNESLAAYSLDEGDNAPAPVISGTYQGEQEGEYYISVYGSGTASGFSFNLSGLESGFAEVFTNNPGPLGTQGLFVEFDEDGRYSRTDWVVPIPNTRSVNYTAKKNAYDQALVNKAIAIANAEDSYLQAEALESDGINQDSRSGVLAARARVQSVRAQMGDGVITAPFDGVIGLLDVSEGEIVSGNTAYITLVGSSQFELSLDVPEIDVAKLQTGDEVSISLDAYGDGSTWTGMISAIDVIDTLVDGVPVYKTTVVITDADERVRVGMSAKATILAEEKFDVVRAPQYFFTRGEGGYEATVLVNDKEETQKVVLGLSGSDGFVEVVSGLSSGDILVRDKEVE